MARKTSLRTELLLNLGLLAAAALLLAVATVLLLAMVDPERAFPLTLAVIVLDVAVFLVFGRYLVNRLVLRPVGRLIAVADSVAAGDFAARAPEAETEDFDRLAQRLNRMTDHLLDAQSQVVRSEKLASLGLLAGGIAHEIGNPLGALGTYVEVLRRRGVDAGVVVGLNRELERIDRIVRSLLDYARPRDETLGPVDPGPVLQAAHALLETQGVARRAEVTLDLGPELPSILGRAHLLEQVIVNLMLNALDAASGGRIVLGARRWAYEPGRLAPRRDSDAAPLAFARAPRRRPGRADFPPGAEGALLFVADSGPGVPSADRERIFEPFFTTKAPGHGTGLGLAIVARAVDDMGGVVWVDAAREGGAAFKMFFAAARSAAGVRS